MLENVIDVWKTVMERLTPGSLTSPFEPAYLANLTQQINYITSKGAYAIVQPHNYGRFYGKIMTDVTGFQTWWRNVAMQFANNSLAVFDVNNEFHDMPQDLVFNLNQAAINGIRSANATTQYITAEGNSYTAAYNWITSGNGASLINLHDPSNKLIYQFHQYLDYDYSGTHEECDSPTIFRSRLQEATKWLRDNKQTGLIGEYAGGNNPTCIEALKDGLQFLNENNDVWAGAVWWAAGPMWYQYMYSMDPGTPTGAQRTPGVAYTDVLPVIKPYFFY